MYFCNTILQCECFTLECYFVSSILPTPLKFTLAVVSDMQLSVSTIEFPRDAAFIRGYNTTIEFNFTLINLETNLAVDAGVNNTANYDVTVVTAQPAQPASRRRRDVSADLDTAVTQSAQFADDQLAQRLDYGSEITVTGEVLVKIGVL